MNWPLFFVTMWIALGLELGLVDSLSLEHVTPSVAIPLLTFVALFAPRDAAMWAALAIGFALDIIRHYISTNAGGPQSTLIIGPYTLGCLFAAFTVLTLRGAIMKKNPLAMIALGFAAAFATHLLASGLLTVRSWYDPMLNFSPGAELGRRFLSSVYTGLITPVVMLLLAPAHPFFSFQAPQRANRYF